MSLTLHASGGVVTRHTASGIEILLVHRRRYDDWSLPKGKPEAGETPEQTALREVREETGQPVEIIEYLGETRYSVNHAPKAVQFWRMRPVGDPQPISDTNEVAEAVWFPVSEAITRLTYPTERQLLARILGD